MRTYSAVFLASSLLLVPEVRAQGTETRHCITNAGNLRIFVQHSHGALSGPSTAGTMTIQDLNAGTSSELFADGVINDALNVADIAGDCASGTTVLDTSCASGDNDWVYTTSLPNAIYHLITGKSEAIRIP
jgi:hypothetical protein